MEKLEWGTPVEGWQLSLSLDNPKAAVCGPVMVTLVTRNVSNKPLKLPVVSMWTAFSFQVRDEGGEVPLTRFGRRMEGNRMVSGHGETNIQPNESLTVELPLARFVDLTPTGTYTVTASRSVLRQQGVYQEVPLVSNRVTFEIVEE
jgi:hypothetical protein